MVGHHIPQRAGSFVKTAALLDADGFRSGDLDMIDMIAAPHWFEDAVRGEQLGTRERLGVVDAGGEVRRRAVAAGWLLGSATSIGSSDSSRN